jgi:hypothetical protein
MRARQGPYHPSCDAMSARRSFCPRRVTTETSRNDSPFSRTLSFASIWRSIRVRLSPIPGLLEKYFPLKPPPKSSDRRKMHHVVIKQCSKASQLGHVSLKRHGGNNEIPGASRNRAAFKTVQTSIATSKSRLVIQPNSCPCVERDESRNGRHVLPVARWRRLPATAVAVARLKPMHGYRQRASIRGRAAPAYAASRNGGCCS